MGSTTYEIVSTDCSVLMFQDSANKSKLHVAEENQYNILPENVF